MLFRFWRWRIEVKLRNLDDDKKIIFLGQELIKAVAKSGREMQGTSGMVSFDIDVFRHNNEGYVNNVIAKWKLPLGKITCIEWDKNSSPAIGSSQES